MLDIFLDFQDLCIIISEGNMIDRLIVWPPKCPKISNKWSHVEMYVHNLTGHIGGYFSVDLNNNLSSYLFVTLKNFFLAKIHILTGRFIRYNCSAVNPFQMSATLDMSKTTCRRSKCGSGCGRKMI